MAETDESNPSLKKFRSMETPYGFHLTAFLSRSFSGETEESLNAGMAVTIEYHLRFKQYRWYWDTKVLGEAKYSNTVIYDTLRRIYTITRRKSGASNPIGITTTEDAATMKLIMSSFEGDLDFNLRGIKEGKQYYFALQASISAEAASKSWDSALYANPAAIESPITRLWLPIKQEAK
jgi:hypothetical protein